MELPTVVLADFANEEEYDAIKNTQGVGKSSLRIHKKLIEEAVRKFRKQGYGVVIEICDFEGYKEFCITQKALNTPQTVAAYVNMKYRGLEKQFIEGLDHQYITVDRTAEVFCEMCKKSGLKKSEFAKICGISQTALNQYLTGAVAVPQEILERVQDFRKD